MNFLLLTKSTVPVIGWIATVLGYIMDGIYRLGVHNVALDIIIFTVIINVLMLPLTIKQQKFMKLNNVMQPELQAMQKKYKGKNDQQSQSRMMAEQQAIYEKYGAKPTAGCLTTFIQLPILFALYQVIYRIPAYISGVNTMLANVAEAIMKADPQYIEKISELASKTGAIYSVDKVDYTQVSKFIDLLGKFTASSWEQLKGIFPACEQVITTNSAEFLKINSFLSLNLLDKPGLNLGILIPILAGVCQYFATKTMSTAPTDPDAPGASTMKQMNTMMPLMSVVFCFTFPMGIGIYWVASSAVRWGLQLIINKRMDKIDVNDIIKENIEKQNKKREKKGQPAINAAATMKSINKEHENAEKRRAIEEERKASQGKNMVDSTEYYKSKRENMGTIANRARMVMDYDEKKNKK